MSPAVPLYWSKVRKVARDKRLTGDDLRSTVIELLERHGDPRIRLVGLVASADDVPDISFRAFVILLALSTFEGGRELTDSENDARVRKIGRDLGVSELRAGRALDGVAPALARAGLGGIA